MSNSIPFGIDVFDNNKMKERLSASLYEKILHGQSEKVDFTDEELNEYAAALLVWARERGATRYSHWFSPLGNNTAGKRNSFESIDCDGLLTDKFRGKELKIGEGDASSFPNGGIRQTFEAKGVTRWDYASYAFINEGCLYIPVYFHSFGGESLDKKSPLVKSCRVLDAQAKRLLSLFGTAPHAVNSVVGAEQEYFLVDKKQFSERMDLSICGRTLFGAKPPKLQQLQDHYFALPKRAVLDFMTDVDNELWRLGILVRTEHNEVAPCQFELVPCYQRSPIACDQNQLIMQTLERVAERHDLVCLLHEKPFQYINGSGKHNNWSILADDVNMFEAGNTPTQNGIFVLTVAAVLRAADTYADLLRAFTASATNARRLGGMEAPTNIISVFIGEQLWSILKGVGNDFTIGKDVLPDFPHATDRNRTSPFAFTGNKFELRMVGSSACLADINTALNTMIADSFRTFADRLKGAKDIWAEANKLVAETIAEHANIVYNGNNYDAGWKDLAKQRNLPNLDEVGALLKLTDKKNVELFVRNGIFDSVELNARQDVALTTFIAAVDIEATTSVEMYTKQIAPAALRYQAELVELATQKSALGLPAQKECDLASVIDTLMAQADAAIDNLNALVSECGTLPLVAQAETVRKTLAAMDELRLHADKIEALLPKKLIPYPTYTDMLFLR